MVAISTSPALALLAALDPELLAERQEFRIVLDVRDEREHLVGRMGDGVLGLEDMHGWMRRFLSAERSLARGLEPGEVLAAA